MSITMRDVARAADVSIKTVSRVVNNQGEVAEDTRQRVLKALAGLDFHPSKLARALVTQRSDSIGLVLSDITTPLFQKLHAAFRIEPKPPATTFFSVIPTVVINVRSPFCHRDAGKL